MTTFDERERSYETKFARDEELKFKATARRDRLIGLWAASQLGLSGLDAEEYASSVLRDNFKHPKDEDVVQKIGTDFKAKNIVVSDQEIASKLVTFMAQAVVDIEAGRH